MPRIPTNTLSQLPILVRPREGKEPLPITVTIAASQTIKAGDLLKLTSGSTGAGTYEQALALPGSNNSITSSGGNGIFPYIAAEAITTDSNGIEAATGKTSIQVFETGSTEFGLRFYAAGGASASELQDVAGYGAGTAYIVGRYRFASASAWSYVATSVTTNGEFVPFGPHADNTAATNTYPVLWGSMKATTNVGRF